PLMVFGSGMSGEQRRKANAEAEAWNARLIAAEREPAISKQLATFLRDSYEEPQLVPIALYVMTQVGAREDAPAARVHLWSKDPEARSGAINVAQVFADSEALVPLLRLAIHDPDATVRANACRAIPHLKSFNSWIEFDTALDISARVHVGNGRE